LIRVVSWNVLADAYVRREYYPRTPPALLDAASRRQAAARRLAAYAEADVVCLQEVDAPLFALAVGTLFGFTGRLLAKPGRSEGCALFVKHALMPSPVFEELVFGDRSGHIALAAAGAGLTIVSTHLKWEPDGTEPVTHRGRAELVEILNRWPSGSRIVCGDFNAEPDGVVLALAGQRGFSDAYASMPDAFTCNANAGRRRIDFILHTADFTAAPSPLRPIGDDTPLPGADEPSDHLAIEARLHRSHSVVS
jgi:endonuclease/exonuclease/phosphatase family metal-dependent hydrolase